MSTSSLTVVGAHVLCYVNGQLIGRVAGIDFEGQTEFKAARGIDVPYVLEYMPTKVGVAFSLQLIRTVGDGGGQGVGLVAQQNYISRAKYFTLELKDRRTGNPLFRVDHGVATTEKWSAIPRNRMLGTVTCFGIMYTTDFSVLSI